MPIVFTDRLGQKTQRGRIGRNGRTGRGRRELAGIMLPFAAGYFLSYWIRTINGPLSDGLTETFGLGPVDLGLLTSMYFLTFAAFQIPAGLLIDRYGPRRVQVAMLLIAALGGFLFATAQGRLMLMLGRALIGLGCSAALVTGVKILAFWMPAERRAMGNSLLVMCGGLGAMASAAPVELVLGPGEWRMLFAWFGLMCLLVSVWVFLASPAGEREVLASSTNPREGMRLVLRDGRFWRLAPLSALVVGSAFAVHGLWAARWLAEVQDASRASIATVLLAMGAGLTAGALLFGVLAERLRRRGITTPHLFTASCAAFLVVEVLLAAGPGVPPMVSLGLFAPFGAITVLSFTIIGEIFPIELSGRANAALNVLHLGAAFAVQAGIGAVVAQWPAAVSGHRSGSAYSTAFITLVALQAIALAWFITGLRSRSPASGNAAASTASN